MVDHPAVKAEIEHLRVEVTSLREVLNGRTFDAALSERILAEQARRIAEAVAAERERCAEVAEQEAQEAGQQASFVEITPFILGREAARISRKIAGKIRSGE